MNLTARHIEYPTGQRLKRVTKELLALPQAECPVVHRFGPGVYIRQITIPAGVFAIGRNHLHEHINVMLSGRVAVLQEDGTVKELRAPLTFLGKPGQKIGVILEEMVWLNVYATTETDIEKLEAQLFGPSEELSDAMADRLARDFAKKSEDRKDFEHTPILPSFNFDSISMPAGFDCRFVISESAIHGKGVVATSTYQPGEIIGPSLLKEGGRMKQTQLWRYTNHSRNPNAILVATRHGGANVVAVERINGSRGGVIGDEITLDYRQVMLVASKQLRQNV